MSVHTKDVFIEVTATDQTKAQIVLATLTTMFSEHSAVPFEIEPVEVIDALGEAHGELPPANVCPGCGLDGRVRATAVLLGCIIWFAERLQVLSNCQLA